MTEAQPPCVQPGFAYGTAILECVSLPLQILLVKILWKDFSCFLPRHKILLSLNISDSTFIFVSGIGSLILLVSESSTGTKLCLILRGIILFVSVMNTVASSLMIIGLSLDRYVCCIHCFHIHEILTSTRVVAGIALGWLAAAIIAAISTYFDIDKDSMFIPDGVSTLTVSIIIAATVIIVTFVQTRLFLLTREKVRVHPAGAFGQQAEEGDLRWREMKIAVSAFLVVVAYIVCMLPGAVVFLVELSSTSHKLVVAKKIVVPFFVANNLINPIIYGFGMADTREALIGHFKMLLSFRVKCIDVQ